MSPVERVLSALEARGLAVRASGTRESQAQCPGHDDRNASLSIKEADDGRVLLCCHAGCQTDSVVAALGLSMRELFSERDVRPKVSRHALTRPPAEQQVAEWGDQLICNERLLDRIAERRAWTVESLRSLEVGWDRKRLTFPIRNREGELVNVCRYAPAPREGEPKMISERGAPRDLFPAPESVAGETVWLVEGEGDAVGMRELGLPAVGLPGVKFADKIDVTRFHRFKCVNVLLDCDRQGREAAKKVAAVLVPAGVKTSIIDLDPSRDDGHDIGAELQEAATDGPGGIASLRRLLERMAPEAKVIEPSRPSAPPGAAAVRANPCSRGESPGWPRPLGPAAFHGLAGTIAKTIEPHTEADVAAVLMSLLVTFGNVIGRGAGFKVGATFHATNLYVLLVGPTSSGRKGTAGDEAARVFEMVDPQWARQRVASGLSSGEGLVWQVRDPIIKRRKARKDEIPDSPGGWIEEVDDAGEPDKRLLVVEAEFAQALKVMQREGNTLSPTLRRLWDRGDARSMVKMSPGRTTDALVSIAGHISAEELRKQLGDTEIANGFANRFAIVCSRRSKHLPFGGDLSAAELAKYLPTLRKAIEHGSRARELDIDDAARAAWMSMYPELNDERLGMLGAVLGRAVPIVRRLSVIYALLDGDSKVGEVHLRAAAEVWRYCVDSARYVFGDALGYPMADKLRRGLREARGKWVTREQLRKVAGGNNVAADEIEAGLQTLADHGFAERSFESSGGRPAEVWRSTEAWEEWEESPPGASKPTLSFLSSHGRTTKNGNSSSCDEGEPASEMFQTWGVA